MTDDRLNVCSMQLLLSVLTIFSMPSILIDKWNKTPEHLYQLGMTASHSRSRERFMALYRVSKGECATHIADAIGRRQPWTLCTWVHRYNDFGSEALYYKRSEGRSPFVHLPDQS